MVKNLCIIQARLTSTRLPNKVLEEIEGSGKTMLEHVYQRLCLSNYIDEIIFAIPDSKKNDKLKDFLEQHHMLYFCGDENDVLDRFYKCSVKYDPVNIIRATCDNPLVDWHLADLLIKKCDNYDYVTCNNSPLGITVEVLKFKALKKAYLLAKKEEEREHVTPFLFRNKSLFSLRYLPYYLKVDKEYRLTVDTDEDLIVINTIYRKLYENKPIEISLVFEFLKNNEEVALINQNVKQINLT